MNENIEEWEKEKLKKLKLNNPLEYKKEFAKQEKRKIEIKKNTEKKYQYLHYCNSIVFY
mgnify:FL=1